MTPLVAARAYGAAIKQAQGLSGSDTPDGLDAPAKADFGQMLKTAMTQTVQSTQNAEHLMVQQQAGKAELIDAVTAVANAQTSLQSVIAIRDQVISAYQQVMQMPI
ncbi:flagellar hook-basal body complex protein FliE [Asticcacaulis sp. EMRT-3]|uniref:flagellar hook-basal body complex protein FliE n=1 Tax=Asticcacaulis sp. EMRT-3 TaxID=3040349 RepID=UPI0024AF6412|nr:flagellar hook-basal body complex protein FliE [Asticcacaulis sp. EMRT-3]MDI7773810.1 flagellar hook-basal body complex protein FliE [Asticcacaulis sp. EMRT-3]